MIPEVKGGNIYHNFHAACDRMSCLINGLSSMNSHISFATSQMTDYSAGDKDYTIFYQSLFLYGSWYMWEVYSRIVSISRNYAVTIMCPGCTKPVPTERIEITGQYIPNPVHTLTRAERAWDTPYEGEIVLGVYVAAKLASAAFTYDLDYHVDDYIPQVGWGLTSASVVTLPMFRKADPRVVLWGVIIRYSYLLTWLRNYKNKMSSAPIVPSSLTALAGCILKSGLLTTYCMWMRINPSHAGSINPYGLSHDLPLGLLRFITHHTSSFLTHGAFHLPSEDPERIMRNCRQIESICQVHLLQEDGVLAVVPEVDQIESSWTDQDYGMGCQPQYIHLLYGTRSVWEGATSTNPHQSITSTILPLPWPLYHLARGAGIISSAASKYLQLLSLPELSGFIPTRIICCAEGDGGLLGSLLHKYPSAYGVFNTLMDSDEFGVVEAAMYVPAGLANCGLTSRTVGLMETVTGETNLASPICIDTIKTATLQMPPGPLLLTMDAERVERDITLAILEGIKTLVQGSQDDYLLILKVFSTAINEDDMNSLLADLRCSGFIGKPISSHSDNAEVFFVVQSYTTSTSLIQPDALQAICSRSQMLATVGNVRQFISIGRDISALHPCTNLAKQNLSEILGMDSDDVSPRKLHDRIRLYLSSTWEELSDDTILCHLVRVTGREAAMENIILPMVLLLEMWRRSPEDICTLFARLDTIRLTIVMGETHQWPLGTTFGIVCEPYAIPSLKEKMQRTIKKVVRAYLALPAWRKQDNRYHGPIRLPPL